MMYHRYFHCTIFSLLVAVALLPVSVYSQYYYKDLVSVDQINRSFRTFKMNKVTKVNLKSYQGNVAVTEGFLCEQTVKAAANQVVTYTRTADQGESFFTSYYNAGGKLVRTTDSSGESISTSLYTYDANGRLVSLTNESRAADKSSSVREVHTWQYNPEGKPSQMVRVKDNTDTTTVKFQLDDKGNVAEEESFRKGRSVEKLYYYYDAKNRLTDIVRYNLKARRLLPDYIFEYEDNDELSVMTIVPAGSTDYQKWFYKYDDNGLKLMDFCYNKKQELLGKVEYSYNFGR